MKIRWMGFFHHGMESYYFLIFHHHFWIYTHWKIYLYGICQKWTNKMRETEENHSTKRTKLRLAEINANNKF